MAKVHVKITPSLAGSLNASGSEWLIFEREIAAQSTIGDIFTDLAFTDAEFRKVVFEPDTGRINELVVVVLNGELLQHLPLVETKLSDGDVVILLPTYMGG